MTNNILEDNGIDLKKAELLLKNKSSRCDHMKYMEGMEDIGSEIMDKVLNEVNNFKEEEYCISDVKNVLKKDFLDISDFKILLSPIALTMLEEIATKAREVTRRNFGTNINIFTPLYISNHCENFCVYCGFNCYNHIKRAKLTMENIEKELKAISKTGLQEILILTGESRKASPVSYIGDAIKLARKYFKVVGIEIYPLNSDEYRYLNECGADYVTVFQETYNHEKYETLHLAGHKRIFPYRFNSQERALIGGMRGVAFASLLGLDDFRRDALATGLHAFFIQRKYPHAEISLSCPRLRPIINNKEINPKDVHERELLQIICAYRLFLPFASITVSTRENEKFRDNIIKIVATKLSAGVDTGIGSHMKDEDEGKMDKESSKGDEQFEISDKRSVEEVFNAIKEANLQPVMSDYIRV